MARKKARWSNDMSVDDKVRIYQKILGVLEQFGGRMDFDIFAQRVGGSVFSGTAVEDSDFCSTIQELVSRGCIRLELRDVAILNKKIVPLIDVIKV